MCFPRRRSLHYSSICEFTRRAKVERIADPSKYRVRRRHTRQELLRVRLESYFCNPLVQIMLLYLIWKVFEFSFTWYTADCSAPRGCRVTDQNKERCWQTPGGLIVQSSKQNNPDLMQKQGLPQLSVCHLAVSWSWASYHTSSERGHSGLPADI